MNELLRRQPGWVLGALAVLVLISNCGVADDVADSGIGSLRAANWREWVGETQQERLRLYQALETSMPVSFERTGWLDALREVESKSGVTIRVSNKLVAETPLADRHFVSFQYDQARLDDLLTEILGTVGLSWTIADDAIVVTTYTNGFGNSRITYDLTPLTKRGFVVALSKKQRADEETMRREREKLTPEEFLLGALANDPITRERPEGANPPLEILIPKMTPEEPWAHLDGVGTRMLVLGNRMTINGPWKIHRRVRAILQTFHECSTGQLKGQTVALMEADDRRAYEAMTKPITATIEAQPLRSVVEQLREMTSERIYLQFGTFRETGDSVDIKVTFRAENIPLRTALANMLEPLGYAAYVFDGAICVTSDPDRDEYSPFTVIYNLSDFSLNEATKLHDSLPDMTDAKWEGYDVFGGWSKLLPHQILVVSQPARVHFQIETLLRELRAQSTSTQNQP